MSEKARDYEFTRADVAELFSASLLPDEFRRKLLKRHSQKELIRLFSSFIGLANSVVASTREFVEEYLVIECDHYPPIAEKINLPTIQGALNGVRVALSPNKGMCNGCAYRLGTPANQSLSTSCDAETCAEDSKRFMCHESLDEKGEPTQTCAGYARARTEHGASCDVANAEVGEKHAL